jgi:hypothetical protein
MLYHMDTGSGKTQFCLSTCAVAAGVGERVVYIDTSNAFSSQRIIQILERRAEQLPRHDQLPLQNNYLVCGIEELLHLRRKLELAATHMYFLIPFSDARRKKLWSASLSLMRIQYIRYYKFWTAFYGCMGFAPHRYSQKSPTSINMHRTIIPHLSLS